MAALAAVEASALSADERLTVVEAWEKQQGWVAAQAASELVAVVGERPVDADDFVREDVRAALNLSRHAAVQRVDVARALATRLGATRAALAAGDLTYRHAVVLVDELAGASPEVVAAVQNAVLGKGQTQTVGEFRRSVARAKLAADPKTFAEQRAAAEATRQVVCYPDPAGMATVAATLTAEGARTVMLALDAVAAARAATHPDPKLGVDARRADALVALCQNALADPALPKRHGRPVHVQLVTDLPTLLHLADHPGDLLGYGPIPAPAVRALAADATWQRLIVEPATGHLLDLGTTRYRPSQALADFVLARTPECTFTTCHTPAHHCEIDHAHPHGSGGPTSPANTRPHCKRHHQLKTHGGWRVQAHPDGSTTWTSPHHRAYFQPAKDLRPNPDHRPGAG
jgi:Domain of unknown function (DUF222)